MIRVIIYFPLLIAMLLSFGCGGGGGSGASQPKKAVVAFSLVSTSKLPFRLNGVEIRATLPAGVTVTSIGTAITSGLEAGNVVNTMFPVFGSYSAPNRIHLMIVDSSNGQNGFGPGEIVRLTCSLAAGATFSESDRTTLENAVIFKASWYDPINHLVLLNGYLKPKIAVTINN